jgi:glutamyl-tRNA synthetase
MTKKSKVRVRFAPSPTGSLHIGGARTALFNWLFARHEGGTFILRIEDTDRERSTEEFTATIMDGMKWLGFDWDEGPYHQMDRMDLYREHVDKLLKEGKAYRCYCSAEELEAKRQAMLASGRKPKYDGTCRNRTNFPDAPYAIRLKSPQEGVTAIDDVCRGHIEFDNRELDDLIILRSDGTPTYNFTVVVDDVTMNITHVIRGDDHLNNTPRQVLIYQAFGYPLPIFAHLPMIFGPDKKKLSKRHGATAVIDYKAMGYLPEAVVNYLARLGWSYKNQEIFTREEMIEKFDLSVVGKAPSVFDIEKLQWVNSQHLAKYSNEQLVDLASPFLKELGFTIDDRTYAAKALASERERGRTLKELALISAFYFRDHIEYDPAAAGKWLGEKGKDVLKKLRDRLATLDDFSEPQIAKVFEEILAELNLKMLDVAQPCRVAMTGTTVSPGIHLVLTILGKKRVLTRIERAILFNP